MQGIHIGLAVRYHSQCRVFPNHVASVGSMDYRRLMTLNVTGAILWINLFTIAGYLFGNVPFIQDNFHYVILVIIFLSVLPMIYEYIQNKRHLDVPSVPLPKPEKVVNE